MKFDAIELSRLLMNWTVRHYVQRFLVVPVVILVDYMSVLLSG